MNQTLKPKIGFQVIQGKPQYVQVTIPNDWKLEPFEKHYELIKGKIPKTLFETNGIGKLPYLTSGYLKGDDEEYAEKSDGVLVNESDVIMIGDGYTDINTRCYDNTIVRYKGIIDRDINIKGDYCISDFEQFIDII